MPTRVRVGSSRAGRGSSVRPASMPDPDYPSMSAYGRPDGFGFNPNNPQGRTAAQIKGALRRPKEEDSNG